jgi:N-acetylneuraminic acid mutarotase
MNRFLARKKMRLHMTSLFVVMYFGLIMLAGCGGGGGGSSSNTAPSISDLSFSPPAMYVNFGGGQADISGTFDFADPDGDLSTATITVLDAGGHTVQTETIDIADVAGSTSGTIQGTVTITTSVLGDFTVQLYVTDASSLHSNTIVSTFRISEVPWITKSPMPTRRLEFSSATVNGLIYVIGGRDATAPITPMPVVSTVEVYDPATDSWSTGPSLPVPLADQMTIAFNGKIYAIGGKDQFLPTNVVQEFDPATQKWTIRTNMPDERASSAISVNNGLIYISGGEGPGVQLNSLLWYDPVADSWNAGSPMTQSRGGVRGATIGGQILVYGGYSTTHILDAGYLKSVESYDPVMDTWSGKADGNPRRDFGVAVINNLMYVFGGNNVARALDWVNVYDSVTNQWAPKSSMPSSLGFVRAETIGNKIYIFDTNTTLEYTPSNDLL